MKSPPVKTKRATTERIKSVRSRKSTSSSFGEVLQDVKSNETIAEKITNLDLEVCILQKYQKGLI
jgi:hypothetical protein